MIVLTIAGQSSRFKNEGYSTVKYKLDLCGKSIIENILSYIPKKSKILLVINKKFNDKQFFQEILEKMQFDFFYIAEIGDTDGQLISLELGLSQIDKYISKNEPLTIYNGDTIRMIRTWERNDNSIEVFKEIGSHWSFVDTIGKVSLVREKQRISEYCSSGLYHFESLGFFRKHFKSYLNISDDSKEFFIAPFYDYLIQQGHEIKSYLSARKNFLLCGTPEEYETTINSFRKRIPFTSRFKSPDEKSIVSEALDNEKLSGNSTFNQKAIRLLENKFGFTSFLTPSATAAMEMICDIIPKENNSEVIIPSYTFVSSALPFTRKGWKVVFCDSLEYHPNIDLEKAKLLISKNTKAIVIVNYGGIFFQQEALNFFKNRGIIIIEDAAQSIGSFWIDRNSNKRYFGSIGDLSVMSFHYTKNIGCGEGGLLIVNDKKYIEQAHIAQEKGTNRTNFLTGKVDKYKWLGNGSSYLLGDLTASLLYSQLLKLEEITDKRREIINYYQKYIEESTLFIKQKDFENIYNNGHIFYLLFRDESIRKNFQFEMNIRGIECSSHYQCLHKSPFAMNYLPDQFSKHLTNADRFEKNLIRLPVHFNITEQELKHIVKSINDFSKKN